MTLYHLWRITHFIRNTQCKSIRTVQFSELWKTFCCCVGCGCRDFTGHFSLGALGDEKGEQTLSQ